MAGLSTLVEGYNIEVELLHEPARVSVKVDGNEVLLTPYQGGIQIELIAAEGQRAEVRDEPIDWLKSLRLH